MNLANALRTSIVLQLMCIAASVVLVPSLDNIESDFSFVDGISLVQIIVYFLALFLMFSFKNLGRSLFVVAGVAGIPLTVYAPEYLTPSSNLYELLIWCSGLLDGLMLAMIYLTDLRHRFATSS